MRFAVTQKYYVLLTDPLVCVFYGSQKKTASVSLYSIKRQCFHFAVRAESLFSMAVPWRRRLVVCLLPGFDPWPVHVTFLLGKVALRQYVTCPRQCHSAIHLHVAVTRKTLNRRGLETVTKPCALVTNALSLFLVSKCSVS